MPDDTPPQTSAPTEAAPAARPEPPPYNPDKDLIGYIEKGQKPAAPSPRPTEKK